VFFHLTYEGAVDLTQIKVCTAHPLSLILILILSSHHRHYHHHHAATATVTPGPDGVES
jgi:hypothetical protein